MECSLLGACSRDKSRAFETPKMKQPLESWHCFNVPLPFKENVHFHRGRNQKMTKEVETEPGVNCNDFNCSQDSHKIMGVELQSRLSDETTVKRCDCEINLDAIGGGAKKSKLSLLVHFEYYLLVLLHFWEKKNSGGIKVLKNLDTFFYGARLSFK